MPRVGTIALLLLLVFVVPSPSAAQAYPAATPAARTIAPAQLEALARDREVVERFRRGLDAAARSDWRASADEFSRVVSLDPPEPRGSTARYNLGIALANAGAYAAAEDAFEDALERDPGFAAAAANLVETALAAGDLPRARRAADRFVAIAPASLRARYSRGLVALKQNDLATARADFTSLTAGAPAYALAHYDLAVTEIRAANYPAAQRELETALALSPGYARARFALATLKLREDRRAEAGAELARVMQDASDPALRGLAATLSQRLKGAQP
jgi:tetratricopeptide (TPR) repeat protein